MRRALPKLDVFVHKVGNFAKLLTAEIGRLAVIRDLVGKLPNFAALCHKGFRIFNFWV